MRDYSINEAGEFIYSTYLPPASAAVATAAIELTQGHPEWRTVAHENARLLRQKLRATGWDVIGTESAIVPIICRSSENALALAERCRSSGIRVGAIRPPTVPKDQARIRLSLKANLSESEYHKIYDCFNKAHA